MGATDVPAIVYLLTAARLSATPPHIGDSIAVRVTYAVAPHDMPRRSHAESHPSSERPGATTPDCTNGKSAEVVTSVQRFGKQCD